MADVFPGATLVQTDGFYARTTPDPSLAVSCIHITASLRSAQSEVTGRQQANGGVTATFFVDPDGTPWQQLGEPTRMGPWTNGVLNRPDLTNPRMAAIVRDGVNPNLRCLVTIENVGIEPGNPITAAQEATAAKIIAHYHPKIGLPINRETVVGHYQFDSVNRPNCPSTNKAVIDRIVALAAGGTDDMNLKGTPVNPVQNRKTTLKAGGAFVVDPTAAPYDVITSYQPGQLFIPNYLVKGNSILGTDQWYGGFEPFQRAGQPTAFGYLSVGLCNPLAPIEAGGDTAAAYNAGLGAAKQAVEAVPPK
jgi:hypothetical protein